MFVASVPYLAVAVMAQCARNPRNGFVENAPEYLVLLLIPWESVVNSGSCIPEC